MSSLSHGIGFQYGAVEGLFELSVRGSRQRRRTASKESNGKGDGRLGGVEQDLKDGRNGGQPSALVGSIFMPSLARILDIFDAVRYVGKRVLWK